jgi:molybdopterin converting factor small subunit
LFANLRESAGTTSAVFEGDTVGAVLDAAVSAYGTRFADGLATARVWVNGDPAAAATPVGDDDEIALIPPVSGGAQTAAQQAAAGRAAIVVALVLAVGVGNFVSPELFVFVTVGTALAWLWDVRDALVTRGAPVQIIPVMAAAAAGANGAYGWGAAGLAGGLAVGLIIVLTWAVVDRRARSIDAVANGALLGIASGLATGGLTLVHLRDEDELTLFLALAAAVAIAAWAADRFAPPTAGIDPNVAGLLTALVAGVATGLATDILTLAVLILVSVAMGAGFIAGRVLGSLARTGAVLHTARAPGMLTVFDGPMVAAGLFWAVLALFA